MFGVPGADHGDLRDDLPGHQAAADVLVSGDVLSQSKNSVSALELKRHLGVRYKTAWLMKHKL